MCGALEAVLSTIFGVGDAVGNGAGVVRGLFVGLGVTGAVAGVGNRVGSFVRGEFVGLGVGNRVGYAVRGLSVGSGVRFCVGDGLLSHGVFGKQARPEGHSDEDPLGHGFKQFVEAS